jgi:hypothetical protein
VTQGGPRTRAVRVLASTGGIVAVGMRPCLALALSLLAAPTQPEIRVSLQDGRVVVRTARAPLAEVLKRFAEATGMEVVYEAARPRQLVTVTIEAASAAQALQQLLEGQGLNYILRLDSTGKLVRTLVVAGSPSSAPAPASAARSPRASPTPFRPPAEEEQEEPAEDESPGEFESVAPSPPPGSAPGESASPVPGAPWPGAPPGVAPGQEPSPPATSPGSTAPQPGQPQPPAPASYPGGAPATPPEPQPPVPPAPASYP